MLSYHKIQQGFVREMMPIESMDFLYNGFERRHIQRNSAKLEVKYYVDERTALWSSSFGFFMGQPVPLMIQVAQKYIKILQGNKEVVLTMEDKNELNSIKDDALALLVEKHELITLVDDSELAGGSWVWR